MHSMIHTPPRQLYRWLRSLVTKPSLQCIYGIQFSNDFPTRLTFGAGADCFATHPIFRRNRGDGSKA